MIFRPKIQMPRRKKEEKKLSSIFIFDEAAEFNKIAIIANELETLRKTALYQRLLEFEKNIKKA